MSRLPETRIVDTEAVLVGRMRLAPRAPSKLRSALNPQVVDKLIRAGLLDGVRADGSLSGGGSTRCSASFAGVERKKLGLELRCGEGRRATPSAVSKTRALMHLVGTPRSFR